MTVKRVTLAQLKALARNEISCEDIAAENNFQEGDPVKFTKKYAVTLEDMRQAVENSKLHGSKAWKSFIDWAVSTDRSVIGSGLIFPEESEPLLPQSEYDYLVCVVKNIRMFTLECVGNYWSFEAEKWDVAKIRKATKNFFKDIETYFHAYEVNKGKDPTEWYVAPLIGERYLMRMDSRMYDESVSEKDCAIFKYFMETLLPQKSFVAMHILTYLYYNGSKVYPQNWKKSRTLLEKLFKRTMRPDYANSLGYIYYYGRCSGGEPEYEKAFPYFQYAAGQGVIEADYKLADMFLHGYGTLKNVPAAERIIDTSYHELLDRFRQGEYDGKFADIALRKGRLMEYLAEERPSEKDYYHILAHKYYLMAQLAIKARRTAGNNYGDAAVEENINKALANIKKLTKSSDDGSLSFFMSDINTLCSINSPVKISFEVMDIDPDDLPDGFEEDDLEGSSLCIIKIWFADEETGTRKGNMLITIPEIDYCGLDNEAVAHVFVANPDAIRRDAFWCTRISINPESGMLEFYRFSELMQTLPNSINIEVAYTEPTQFYRMAEVYFPNSEEEDSYSYLCPQLDIHEGDDVLVMAGDHKTTVHVESIYLAADVDLEFPFEKYKTVLQKI